jgi:hypothetical protein
MMKRGVFTGGSILLISIFAFSAANLQASLVATSTAEQITDSTGTYYKYTINVEWDFAPSQNGISNWGVDLNPTLLCPYALKDEDGEITGSIWFEDPTTYVAPSDGQTYPYLVGIDGQSTPENGDMLDVMWFGSVELNSSMGNGIKYEQPLMYDSSNPAPGMALEPGPEGNGQFWFYSVFGPVSGTWDDVLFAKANSKSYTGSLSGELPYCIPEPATLLLLSFGGIALIRKKK